MQNGLYLQCIWPAEKQLIFCKIFYVLEWHVPCFEVLTAYLSYRGSNTSETLTQALLQREEAAPQAGGLEAIPGLWQVVCLLQEGSAGQGVELPTEGAEWADCSASEEKQANKHTCIQIKLMISSQTAENNDRTPNCSKGVAARDWPTRGRTETPVMETG